MTSDDDLRATIARLRGSVERNAVYGYRDLVIEDDDLTALLDAAERSWDARNAALEEAAKMVEAKPRSHRLTTRQEISAAIRALKEPTHE